MDSITHPYTQCVCVCMSIQWNMHDNKINEWMKVVVRFYLHNMVITNRTLKTHMFDDDVVDDDFFLFRSSTIFLFCLLEHLMKFSLITNNDCVFVCVCRRTSHCGRTTTIYRKANQINHSRHAKKKKILLSKIHAYLAAKTNLVRQWLWMVKYSFDAHYSQNGKRRTKK